MDGQAVLSRLEAAYTTCNQQQAKTDDPRPGCDGLANVDKTEVRSNRHEEKHQANKPYRHRWSFTGIAHFVPL
jgi:hypothetical protein